VVLGLVSAKPGAGHELSAYAERSIGQFFPLTRSHVYKELDRLCQLGLLDATEVSQERFPTKRVYAITAAGEAVLSGWLDDAGMPGERLRNLFLVHVFLGDRMSSARLEEMLDNYELATRARREQLRDVVDNLSRRTQSRFHRATAMFGLAQAQATLDWLAEVRPLLLEAPVEDRSNAEFAG
jgi:DNA-binding PadR family transcriptional regulator